MTSTFEFTPAKRENVSLLIALAGASGSGKTMSALRLAQGISPAGKIAFIDTEARRGLHYADKFKFMHADMRAPFRPARFLEGIRAAEAAGSEVIIIDSFSHEYDGEGGLIEWADELGRTMKAPLNWSEPKTSHRKMVGALLQSHATLIFCLRADEKIEVVRENGKTQIRPLGWMPICEKRFMYEMAASFTLTPDRPGKPNFQLPHKLQEQHRPFFPADKCIDEEAGRLLAEWARGGVPAPEAAAPPVDHSDDHGSLFAAGQEHAERGMPAYEAWFKGLSPAVRKKIAHRHEEWKATAAAADEAFAREEA